MPFCVSNAFPEENLGRRRVRLPILVEVAAGVAGVRGVVGVGAVHSIRNKPKGS